jgi:hypothetical protein
VNDSKARNRGSKNKTCAQGELSKPHGAKPQTSVWNRRSAVLFIV